MHNHFLRRTGKYSNVHRKYNHCLEILTSTQRSIYLLLARRELLEWLFLPFWPKTLGRRQGPRNDILSVGECSLSS